MQRVAIRVEPALGTLPVRADARDDAPEARRVVHLDEMRDLVRRQIVEHERRGENEPPRIRQHAAGRARAPAAGLIPYRHALDRDPERGRVTAARRLKVALRLALEEIAHAPCDMRGIARDAKERAVVAIFGPDGAARAGPMRDAMHHAAQRHTDAVRERDGLRQALQPRRDPGAVALRERLRLAQRAARRHGEHDRAVCGLDAQRVAPRLRVTAQRDLDRSRRHGRLRSPAGRGSRNSARSDMRVLPFAL